MTCAWTKANGPELARAAWRTLVMRAVSRYFLVSIEYGRVVFDVLKLRSDCSRFIPISKTQLRTSAAMPPDTYAGALLRGRPRRRRVREDGENGVGREEASSSALDGGGERGSTKAGFRLCCVEIGGWDAGMGAGVNGVPIWLEGGCWLALAESMKRGW